MVRMQNRGLDLRQDEGGPIAGGFPACPSQAIHDP